MTIHFSQFKYIILITIYIVCTTSCSKKYIIDNIGEENFYKSIKPCTNNKDFIFNKDVLSKINILENINIIYFDLDQYNILPEFYQILNQHADFLSKNTYCKIVIEGHADKRGTPEYNIALGERRANSVQTYLQSLGVMAQQMSIISYGKEKPASLGYKESDDANNRRVVIVYQTNN